MKKLLALSLIGSSFLVGANPVKADWDVWAAKQSTSNSDVYDLYTLNSDTQEATKRSRICKSITRGNPEECNVYWNGNSLLISPNLNGVIIESRKLKSISREGIFTYDNVYAEYDLSTDTWTEYDKNIWSEDYDKWTIRQISILKDDGSRDVYEKGILQYNIKSDGSLRFGSNSSDISIDKDGLKSGTNNVLIRKDNGDIHIGKNSFVVGNDVLDGAHPIWAEENGSKIPLNIYGSDLQINGVSVQGQIDTNTSNISTNTSNISTNTSNIKNLGQGVAGSTALTAALTALPQTSKESKLSCGVGSGAYSSRYAVSFGCASKVNERVDINAGGSYVFGGSKSYGEGTLDNGVIKAGFVFKLGELNKPTQISMKDKKVMETKIESLEEKNKKILSKNQKLENKLSILMARLEKIEKIALSESKSKDIAVYKLK